jgi:hypothetical protein
MAEGHLIANLPLCRLHLVMKLRPMLLLIGQMKLNGTVVNTGIKALSLQVFHDLWMFLLTLIRLVMATKIWRTNQHQSGHQGQGYDL